VLLAAPVADVGDAGDVVQTTRELGREYQAIDQRVGQSGFTATDAMFTKGLLIIGGAFAYASNQLGFGGFGEDVARDSGEAALRRAAYFAEARADEYLDGKGGK
jgi:hypothetical protein